MGFRSTMTAMALVLSVAACSQGSSITSPGASNAGTGTGGGSGGGSGGSGSSASCPTGFTEGTPVGNFTTCDISGTILSDLSLPFVDGIAYRLAGRVDVGVDVGADGNASGGTSVELEIEPGVILFGEAGEDHLVVNRGSTIEAAGTATSPIVFTSADDLERRAVDPNDNGGSNIGEWGGLVLLGQAPINECITPGAVGGTTDCEAVIEGVQNPNAIFGGDDPNDYTGTLNYVQVRFAGNPLATGNELNGISFGGVGDGSTVEYVQVHNNSDDGVEFFGGTVDVKYLVLTGNDDDSIDTDLGFQGTIQYALVIQRAAGGDNMVEASGPDIGLTPVSNATVSNFTFVNTGTSGGNGIRVNTGTIGTYVNGVVVESNECLRYQDSAGDGVQGFTAGADPAFQSVLFDCGAGLSRDDTVTASAAVAADANNVEGANSLINGLISGPNEGAIAAVDPSTLDPALNASTYVGAIENAGDTWWQTWTCGLETGNDC